MTLQPVSSANGVSAVNLVPKRTKEKAVFVHDCIHPLLPPYMSKQLETHYSTDKALRDSYKKQLASNMIIQKGAATYASTVRLQRWKFKDRGAKAKPIPSKLEVWNATSGLQTAKFVEENTNDLVATNLYKYMKVTDWLFIDQFDRILLNDLKRPLCSYLHVPGIRNNACWRGLEEVVYFGEVDKDFFRPFESFLDIVGHEFTHGFTQYSCSLLYEMQSGALNESISDVFGVMARQFCDLTEVTQDHWLVGDGLLINKNGQALRSLQAPGSAYKDHPVFGNDPQPMHMRDFVQKPNDSSGDHGGVHLNSGIPNHAFFLSAMSIGGHSWEKTGKIWFNAVLNCEPRDDFSAFAKKTMAAAKGYGDSVVNLIGKAWQDVGVDLRNPKPQRTWWFSRL